MDKEKVMNNKIENIDLNNLPKELDSINFNYKDITFHVYGVLHALTGGTNQEYVKHVNHTIKQAKGIKLCEKSMKTMYKGLDEELDDWIQVPLSDVFHLTFNLVKNPLNWWKITKSLIKEKITKKDRFGINGAKRIEDIGGSMAFHTIAPEERRQMAGFPPAKDYLVHNLSRRLYKRQFNPPRFPDKDWQWLSIIEPYANIPCRSIHMIETAVDIAKRENKTEASLFIGEIHNTDILWYVNRHTPVPHDPKYPAPIYTINDWLEKHINSIVIHSKKYSKENKWNYMLRKFQYFGMSALGATAGFALIIFIIAFINANFIR